jgi:hypothetical protein
MHHGLQEFEREASALADGATREARAALESVVREIRTLHPEPQRAPNWLQTNWLQKRATGLAAIGAAYALFLLAAHYVSRDYVPVQKPDGAILETVQYPRHLGGFSYNVRSYILSGQADPDERNQRSPVILYEDLTPLGPAHSRIKDIAREGHGRYAFVGRPSFAFKEIIFSSSDNSDPRTNGRNYWLVLPHQP